MEKLNTNFKIFTLERSLQFLTRDRKSRFDKIKHSLIFLSLFVTFSILMVWTTPLLFAQGGRWQIQYDNEANETLGLNGKTLQGSFVTLSECETYRKSLSAYEQSHSKSVRSDVSEASTNQQVLPKQPNALRPAPPPSAPDQAIKNSPTTSSKDQVVNSNTTKSARKVLKKIESPVIQDQTIKETQASEADAPEIVVQTGHLKQVNAVALSPDGRFAVSGGRDGMIKLWDVGSGKEIRTFKGNNEEVSCIAISPDSRFAVIGNEMYSHNVQLWDISTGKLVRTFLGWQERVTSVAFSPDGQLIIAAGGQIVKVWRTETGEEVRTFSGHTAELRAVAISRDGRYVVSGGNDKMVKIWELESGKNIRTLSGHTDNIEALSISPDGRFIISGSFNDNPRMWDMNTGSMLKTFDRGGVLSLAISPDGKTVIFGGEPDIEVWNITRGKKIETLKGGEPGWVRSLCFSQDGKFILSGGDDTCVKLWNRDSGKKIWSSEGESQVASAAISSDGGKLIAGMASGRLYIRDLFTGKQIQTIKQSVGVNCVTIGSEGKKSFAGGWDFKDRRTCVKQWDTSTAKELAEFHQDGGAWVNNLALTSDGNNLLWSVRADLILSDIATGQKIRSFNNAGQYEIRGINTFGKYAITADDSDDSHLLNIETGEAVYSFKGYHATLCHDNHKLLLMGQEAEDQLTIKLWDIDSKRDISSLSVYYPMKVTLGKDFFKTRGIRSLTISPDDRLALWCYDNELHLWNIAEGKEIFLFSGHTSQITSIGFSPNGKIAYSASLDGSTRLWNTETGKEMVRFYSFKDGEWLTITPGGYFDASLKGADHLAVREENFIHDINRVQNFFQSPTVIQTVLMGDEPPTDQTVASVLAINYNPSASYNVGFGLIELLLLFILFWFAPFLIALIDILRHNFSGNNKIVWLLVLMMIPCIGSILYFAIGRKQKLK